MRVHLRLLLGLCCSIFSFLCSVLYIIVLSFCLLTIVLSAFNLRLLITVLESSTFSYIILNLNMSSWRHFTISYVELSLHKIFKWANLNYDFRLIISVLSDNIFDNLLTVWSTISIIVEWSIDIFICISWLNKILISDDRHLSSETIIYVLFK